MTGDTILQIFLFLQVFIIGVLTTLAVHYARAHFKAKQQPLEPAPVQSPTDVEIPATLKAHLLQASQAQFEEAVKNSAAQLQNNLAYTNEQINNLVMKLATDVVSNELTRYKADLDSLEKKAETEMGGIRLAVESHEAELKARLAQEMEAEKQRLLKLIDTKLADAVGSFLTETLQHHVDLGSQSAYLVAMLEEHKADFVKEVADGTQPTK